MNYGIPNYSSALPWGANIGALHPTFASAPMVPPGMPPTIGGMTLPMGYYPPMVNNPGSIFPTGPVMTAAGPLAQSIPLGPLPPLPTPDAVAPCLFSHHVPYGVGYIPPGMTNFYNYNTAPYMPWAAAPPPMPMPPPFNNPGTQPIGQPPQTPPTPPEPKKPEESLPRPVKESPTLTADAVQEINSGLESPSFETRLMAANRLSQILDGDPELLSKPQYAKYAEALILKALKDPNSIVRQPLLMSMELGNIATPTPRLLTALNGLKKERGMYNLEPPIISKVLKVMESKLVEAKQKAMGTGPEALAKAAGIDNPEAAQMLPAGRALGGRGQAGGVAMHPAMLQAMAQGRGGPAPDPAVLAALAQQRPMRPMGPGMPMSMGQPLPPGVPGGLPPHALAAMVQGGRGMGPPAAVPMPQQQRLSMV